MKEKQLRRMIAEPFERGLQQISDERSEIQGIVKEWMFAVFRTLILINGGAIVAIFGVLSAHSDTGPLLQPALAAMSIYALGIVMAVLGALNGLKQASVMLAYRIGFLEGHIDGAKKENDRLLDAMLNDKEYTPLPAEPEEENQKTGSQVPHLYDVSPRAIRLYSLSLAAFMAGGSSF